MLDDTLKTVLLESFEKTKCRGIHIHVPEGATPKDGPSGGAAITTVIYSLLAQRKINKDFAMTGEICLQG
jgi:ATP-dependent Lon protease